MERGGSDLHPFVIDPDVSMASALLGAALPVLSVLFGIHARRVAGVRVLDRVKARNPSHIEVPPLASRWRRFHKDFPWKIKIYSSPSCSPSAFSFFGRSLSSRSTRRILLWKPPRLSARRPP